MVAALLGGATALFLQYGHRWCPELVIAWSPVADQVAKAALRTREDKHTYHAVSPSAAQLRHDTARLPPSAFAALIRSPDAAAGRALQILAVRASSEPEALSALTSCLTNPNWQVRYALVDAVASALIDTPTVELAAVITPLFHDPHPLVAQNALYQIQSRILPVSGFRVDSIRDSLLLALEYRVQVDPSEIPMGGSISDFDIGFEYFFLQDDPPDLRWDSATAEDIASFERQLRRQAWSLLADIEPATCIATLRSNWPNWTEAIRQQHVDYLDNAGAEVVPWLVEVAKGTQDPGTRHYAIQTLACIANPVYEDLISIDTAWQGLAELSDAGVGIQYHLAPLNWSESRLSDERLSAFLRRAEAGGWLIYIIRVMPVERRQGMLGLLGDTTADRSIRQHLLDADPTPASSVAP